MSELKQENIAQLEQTIGYVFANKNLVIEALTHPSIDTHTNADLQNYQRLEFLGDRVLGLIIAEMLLVKFPNEAEGDIARRHTVLVQARALFEVANEVQLGTYISLSRGEQKTGGRYKMAVLSDATEAIIGAIYLDGGIEPARRFIGAYWSAKLESYEAPPIDSKTQLQEWAQSKSLPLPHYVLLERSGTDHEPVFDMEVRVKGLPRLSGQGNSKRTAQKEAAKAALEFIEQNLDKKTS